MKILLLNQCFYPDVVSTAQHLTDLAVALSGQGHKVTVIASRRGYDNPEVRFPAHEVWRNIEIIRIPSLGLGKKAKWRRAIDFGSFLLSCIYRLLLLPKFDIVVALTSPPLISFLGALFVRLKGGVFAFWVMDLNPDEAIAAGWLKESSLVSRGLQKLLQYSLHQARKIIVLDRFMKERILAKGIAEQKLVVLPPWSHSDEVRFDEQGRTAFRAEHKLTNKLVVMYSGNHSPCHPLDTLLEAAERLATHEEIHFCFVGGGSEFTKVRHFVSAHGLENVTCLPYQPLEKLAGSLSAADMHAVVMGDRFTGIVHPCKIYNILAIGAPVLYIGPSESHITDVVSQRDDSIASSARHGEVDNVVRHILNRARMASVAAKVSNPESVALSVAFAKEQLLPRMIEALEALAEPGNDLTAAESADINVPSV
jgi:glycosyltransferase involved in cell wall biosynthesis